MNCHIMHLSYLLNLILFFQLNYQQEQADWSRDMRGKHMRLAVALKTWILVFPKNLLQNARDLAQTLAQVGPPMGMPVDRPRL
jgi:hypothetical protein